MKATFKFSFKSKLDNANRYAYEVTGTSEELAIYEQLKGAWRSKEGSLMYTSKKLLPNVIELVISQDGSFAHPLEKTDAELLGEVAAANEGNEIGKAAAHDAVQMQLQMLKAKYAMRAPSKKVEDNSITETPDLNQE
jgi:hypothetical protein